MPNKLHIKSGNHVFLNDVELRGVIKVSVVKEAARDPVIELQISANEISVDAHMNGIEDFGFSNPESKLEKICKACDIDPLFPSVKDYALHITDDLPKERQTGKTTAICLRILLDANVQTTAENILYQLRHDPDLVCCHSRPFARATVNRLRRMYQQCISAGMKLPQIEFVNNKIKGPSNGNFVCIFDIINLAY